MTRRELPGAIIGDGVQPPKGPVLTTRLFLPDHPANAKDPAFSLALVLKSGGAAFTFDFVLDL